jgi:hypothetical protein
LLVLRDAAGPVDGFAPGPLPVDFETAGFFDAAFDVCVHAAPNAAKLPTPSICNS